MGGLRKKHPVCSSVIVPIQYIQYIVQGRTLVFRIIKHNNITSFGRYNNA